jgi:cytochrome c oxidase subunit II
VTQEASVTEQADGSVTTSRRRLRAVGVAAVLGLVALTLTGCGWREVFGLGWPEGITPEAQANRHLWLGSVIAALIVGVIVYGLMFWTAAFHRKKKGDTELPRQFGYNMPLELVLTVVPFLIISVLFYFTVVTQEKMLNEEPNPEVVVDVTAFQWNWKFGYQKVNYADGSFNYDGADPARKAAVSSKPEGVDSHGTEKVGAVRGMNPEDRSYLNFNKVETVGTSDEIPILVLPVGKRIEFEQASADVIHSFWVPEFLFKRDVFPDPKSNHSDNTWQISQINKTGAFVGRCAEMCGTYHAMMNFEIRVVEADAFQTYLQQRIDGKTNAEALLAIGEEPLATSTKPFDTRRGERVIPKGELTSQASK